MDEFDRILESEFCKATMWMRTDGKTRGSSSRSFATQTTTYLIPLLFKFEKTPLGIFVFLAALIIAAATNSPVPACIGWDFKITGHPAAKADAVSPPAVEYAKGKLLAPKTKTGPIGINIFLKSGFGTGFLSGMEVSIDTSWKFPSVRSFAKLLSWLTVLFNSALHLASGSPVSEQYTFTISSVINSSSSEIWFKNFDLSNDDTCLNILNASLASLVDFQFQYH